MSDDQYRPHLTVVPPATLPTNDAPDVAGIPQATPDPALQAIPNDEPVGFLPTPWPTNDAPDTAASTPPITAHPVPLIGAIPYGGTVMSSATYTLGAGQTVTIGSPDGSPRVTHIFLAYSLGAGASTIVEILADEFQLGVGYIYDVYTSNYAPIVFPCRSLVVRNPGGAPLSFSALVVGYPVPQP